MFPKHKWINFGYENEVYGETYLIHARGWIGDDIYNRNSEVRTVVEIKRVDKVLDNGKYADHIPNGIELIKIDADAYEYFVVNFAANS
jgi:hypothetical protein